LGAKEKSKQKPQVDQALVKALGHPLRTHALALLNQRVASPNEIARELGERLGDVSYHVKVLSECGFIELVKTEPRRGAVEHFYRGSKRAFLPDDVLRQLPQAAQTSVLSNILTEIFEDVTESLKSGDFNAREECHLSWTPLALDEEGWQDFASLLAETLERSFDIQAESAERLSSTGEDSISATVALMGFESARGSRREKD
jgi:DNA-binding transcriptional ArsR family regulator